jgi:hypothetical protein
MEQQDSVLAVDSQVYVTSYGPFRGLRGTIRTVDTIVSVREDEESFCFYKIALEGSSIRDPIWFECDEVEPVALPSLIP